MLSTGTMGAVDASNSKYYTLMQPQNATSIHLAEFDLKKRTKSVVPLETTVAMGHFVDGHIVGIDDDGKSIYFGVVNASNGACITKTTIDGNYTFDDASLTVDAANHTAYFTLQLAGGGNTFFLFAFSTMTGQPLRDAIMLHPTPDLQGPVGLKYIEQDTILAFMPPVSGAWQLVLIDALSGTVTPTRAMHAVPAKHAIEDGASWLVTTRLPSSGKEGLVLAAALGAGLGTPLSMISFDVDCVRASAFLRGANANCTLSIKPWPNDRSQPTDLGVY